MPEWISPDEASELLTRLGYVTRSQDAGGLIFENERVPADRALYTLAMNDEVGVPVPLIVEHLVDYAGIPRDLIYVELEQMAPWSAGGV